ncbi:MAG TPA: MBL fold metallo-hydrolase [Alphaproteobacteria bacterium]|nr:MBL fold metallo-hydrolase [Alphaproteobacteria bacterium]
MTDSSTRIDEIADGIYRISTPVPPSAFPGGFTFNQFLIADDEPLVYHTGLRGIFPQTRDAIATVLPVETIRYVAFSHFEADECGALNDFLDAAPKARPLCGRVAAMTSIGDFASREPVVLQDGETLTLGKHTVKWFDTPHLPHAWECGSLMDLTTKTLFCGDLFTQPGDTPEPVTEGDILESSEAFRAVEDYFAHPKNNRAMMERLAAENPLLLACMHGSSWRGDGAALLRKYADVLEA